MHVTHAWSFIRQTQNLYTTKSYFGLKKEKNHETYRICIPFNVSYILIVSCLIFHSLVLSGVWCVFVLLCLCFKVSWVILSVISLSEVQLSGVWCVWGLMCLRFDVSGFCLSGVWCVWGLTCLGLWLAPNRGMGFDIILESVSEEGLVWKTKFCSG